MQRPLFKKLSAPIDSVLNGLDALFNFIPFPIVILIFMAMNIKMTIGNGIKLNNASKPFRTESIGADNFLKSGRCMNNHSLICFSIHSAIGTYTS